MANWPWSNAPTRPQVISALAPIRASAATASVRRHNNGSVAAIMPARHIASVTRIFSATLGNWIAITLSVGSPIWRSRSAMAVDDAVGLRIGEAMRLAVGKGLAVGRVDQRQRVGTALCVAAEDVVDGDGVGAVRRRAGGRLIAEDHCSARLG